MRPLNTLLALSLPAARGRGRLRSTRRPLAAEVLESKRLLAVDLVAPIADQSLPAAGAPVQVDLGNAFRLGETLGTVVRIDTNAALPRSSLFIELFDAPGLATVRTTPATAQRFLDYVDDGSFERSIIHRSVDGLIQSGGYTAPAGNAFLPDNSPNPSGYPTLIPSKGTIADEIGNANVRSTIAMAKTLNSSRQPIAGSAANQWFINVVDNRDLDSQYAAFGRVLGDGMETIDVMASVTPFQADTYYDEAFDQLPLWEFPSDQNVRPGNFLTFTHMSRVGADELIEFTASSSNADLIQAEVSGDTLVLSRVGDTSGTASVRVRAISVFDAADFRDYEFTVNVPRLPNTPIELIGSVALSYDAAGRLFADDTMLTLSGNPVDYHAMNGLGWQAVAAETVGSVNTLVWRHASGNLHFWRFSDSWTQQGGDGWQAPGSGEFYATETAFGMDFNNDGVIGAALTEIESVGSVTLAHDSAGSLFAGGTQITLSGNPVDYHAMNGLGWQAVAAENINSVNTLVWRHASGNLHFWRFSSTWAQQGSDGWEAPGSLRHGLQRRRRDRRGPHHHRIGRRRGPRPRRRREFVCRRRANHPERQPRQLSRHERAGLAGGGCREDRRCQHARLAARERQPPLLAVLELLGPAG